MDDLFELQPPKRENLLEWEKEQIAKYGEDFKYSALKNEKFNYFYHSKIGIVKDICDKDDGVWTLPELEDEFLDEIVAQIIFANQSRNRIPQIYEKIYNIYKKGE